MEPMYDGIWEGVVNDLIAQKRIELRTLLRARKVHHQELGWINEKIRKIDERYPHIDGMVEELEKEIENQYQ